MFFLAGKTSDIYLLGSLRGKIAKYQVAKNFTLVIGEMTSMLLRKMTILLPDRRKDKSVSISSCSYVVTLLTLGHMERNNLFQPA